MKTNMENTHLWSGVDKYLHVVLFISTNNKCIIDCEYLSDRVKL